MYKSKIDIDMHLFGKTLRQIMHDNKIKFTEFAADIQLGPKYLTGVRQGKEVYNHAIYVRIVDGLKGYFSEDVYSDIREKLIRASFGDEV
jgi:predicted transcriptional regulator